MEHFRNWLEQLDQTDPLGEDPKALRPHAEDKLKAIWSKTFEVMGISGMGAAKSAAESLSDVTKNRGRNESPSDFTQRVLENEVFKPLKDLGLDVTAAESYLQKPMPGKDKNFGEFLKALFGDHFHQLYDQEDGASSSGKLTGTQGVTPPVEGGAAPAPAPPDQPQPDPNAVPGQPQMPPVGNMPTPPPPRNPQQQMPPVPSAAFMGMY